MFGRTHRLPVEVLVAAQRTWLPSYCSSRTRYADPSFLGTDAAAAAASPGDLDLKKCGGGGGVGGCGMFEGDTQT